MSHQVGRLRSRADEVDLTHCDREPVHIPGAIQSHGVLVAVNPNDLQIVAVSDSITQHFGLQPLECLGRPLDTLNGSALDANTVRFSQESFDGILDGKKHCIGAVVCNELRWEVRAHRHQSRLLLEWEPVAAHESLHPSQLIGELFIALSTAELQAGYDAVVHHLRSFTGFERVMLYQFHEDGHGSVIAESLDSSLNPYLGLHYPASDIPQPARRLYELNWIRGIVDVHAKPSSLIAQTEEPVDLTYSFLRATSPIHVEYLRNMKVGASMSVSIMNGDKLWGLIACHHSTSRYIEPAIRDACELCGTVLSGYLTTRRQQELLKREVLLRDAISEQVGKLSQHDDFAAGVRESAPKIADLFAAQGLVFRGSSLSDETNVEWGSAPTNTLTEAILEKLQSLEGPDTVHTDELSTWLEEARPYSKQIAGMLAMRLGKEDPEWLLLFREPIEQEVLWGGDPSHAKADESGRLSPRKSFEAWKQTVQGRSHAWTDLELQLAVSLKRSLHAIAVEQSARLRAANEELRQLNADLDAFAYAASHDLKEPLRGIHHYTYLLEQALKDPTEPQKNTVSGLKRIVARMNDLLDGLLRFSRAGRADLSWETFHLSEVVPQAIDMVFVEKVPSHVAIQVTNDAELVGDFACAREILSNLISNGVKYNDRENKVIEISMVDIQSTPLMGLVDATHAVCVSDNGIGIDSKYHLEIFEIFRRLHHRDSYGGGSGAGLTIARRMVERHGGRIALESTPDGTRFYFTLGKAS